MDNEQLLDISLHQGKKFMKLQNSITTSVMEGFEQRKNKKNTIEQNINEQSIQEDNQKIVDTRTIQKIQNLEKKYNDLITQYKTIFQQVKTNVDNGIAPAVSTNDQLALDNIKTQLTTLGQDIANYMEKLYSENNKIYEQMNMNSAQFKEKIQMYKNVSLRLQNGEKEGMTNMNIRDINELVDYTNLYVTYEKYNYALWSLLAITAIIVAVKST